jgi:BlaI family penicillinase repressor
MSSYIFSLDVQIPRKRSFFVSKQLPRPTDGELAILRILWDHGPSTVRQVHDHLGRETGYTTILKLLQIMTEKNLVLRDAAARTHIYSAAQPAQTTQRQILKDILERAFSGSSGNLVLQALATKRASAEELAKIRELLDEHQTKGDAQ